MCIAAAAVGNKQIIFSLNLRLTRAEASYAIGNRSQQSPVPRRLRLDRHAGVVHEVAGQADGLVTQGFDHLREALRLDLRLEHRKADNSLVWVVRFPKSVMTKEQNKGVI